MKICLKNHGIRSYAQKQLLFFCFLKNKSKKCMGQPSKGAVGLGLDLTQPTRYGRVVQPNKKKQKKVRQSELIFTLPDLFYLFVGLDCSAQPKSNNPFLWDDPFSWASPNMIFLLKHNTKKLIFKKKQKNISFFVHMTEF